ncbi:hypothetical protein Tco_1544354, partial [Tanacetum coccineum]
VTRPDPYSAATQFGGVTDELALERSESQGYRDAATIVEHLFDDLRSEITCFVSYCFDGLVRKLLSRDEFNTTLLTSCPLALHPMLKGDCRMGRSNAEFKEASHNVFNFFLGSEAEFNKFVTALPSTHFPFLAKIAEATKGALSKVASIQPYKVARSAVPASAPAMSLPIGSTKVLFRRWLVSNHTKVCS